MGRAVFWGSKKGLMGELLGGKWDGIRTWLGGEAKEKQRKKKRRDRKEKRGADRGGDWLVLGILESEV